MTAVRPPLTLRSIRHWIQQTPCASGFYAYEHGPDGSIASRAFESRQRAEEYANEYPAAVLVHVRAQDDVALIGPTNAQLAARIDGLEGRFDGLETRFKNLENLQAETLVALGGIDTRLTEVEKAINRIAPKVGEAGVPSIGGSGLPRAAKRA